MLVSRFRDLLRIDRTDGANHWQNESGESTAGTLGLAHVLPLFDVSDHNDLFHVGSRCVQSLCVAERGAYPVSVSNYTLRPIRNTQQASERMCLLAAPTQGNHAHTRAHLELMPFLPKSFPSFTVKLHPASRQGQNYLHWYAGKERSGRWLCKCDHQEPKHSSNRTAFNPAGLILKHNGTTLKAGMFMTNPTSFELQVDLCLSMMQTLWWQHIKTGGQGQTRLCVCFKAGEHTYASEIQKFGAKFLTR